MKNTVLYKKFPSHIPTCIKTLQKSTHTFLIYIVAMCMMFFFYHCIVFLPPTLYSMPVLYATPLSFFFSFLSLCFRWRSFPFAGGETGAMCLVVAGVLPITQGCLTCSPFIITIFSSFFFLVNFLYVLLSLCFFFFFSLCHGNFCYVYLSQWNFYYTFVSHCIFLSLYLLCFCLLFVCQFIYTVLKINIFNLPHTQRLFSNYFFLLKYSLICVSF